MRLVGGIAVVALGLATAGCGDSSEPRGLVDLGGPPPTFAIDQPGDGDCSFDYRSQISGISPSGGDVQWTVDVPWTNESSLVVDGERVFVVSVDYPNDHPSVLAVDGRDGTPLWQHEIDEVSGPSSPLRVVGDHLAVLDGDAVIALEPDDGREAWRAETATDDALLAIDDTSVYVASGAGGLRAFDASTGEQRWSRPGPADGGSAGVTVADGLVFGGDQTGDLFALDSRTGEERWSLHTRPGRAWWPMLGVVDGTLLVGENPDGDDPDPENPDTLLRAIDTATGADRWTRPAGDHLDPRWLVGDLVILPSDDRLVAVDAATGVERWTLLLGLVGQVTRPAPGLVAVVSSDGYDQGTTVTAADDRTGSVRWTARLPLRSSGPVTSVGGVLLVGGGLGTDSDLVDADADGLVVALDTRTGDELWRTSTRDAAHAMPVEVGGSAVVLSADSSIFCD